MTGTKKLLELNWRLTALDYKELVEPSKPKNIDKATIEELSPYITQCLTIDLVTGKGLTKGDILFNSRAYEINDDYLKLINPFVVVKSTASRSSDESLEIRCAKSCSYLKFRLPDRYIDILAAQLEGILSLIKGKWPKIKTDDFAITKIIKLLRLDAMDDISDIIVVYLKQKNSSEEIRAVRDDQATDEVANSRPEHTDTPGAIAAEDTELQGTKRGIEDLYKEADYTKEEVAPITPQMILRSGRVLRGPVAAAQAAQVAPKIRHATANIPIKNFCIKFRSIFVIKLKYNYLAVLNPVQ
jgi:hypothetical protein